VLLRAGALLYIVALRRIPMSVALPCTAASYIVIAVIGWWFFGERWARRSWRPSPSSAPAW
jgi:drug/metabolite transporter (DMT)-like permease